MSTSNQPQPAEPQSNAAHNGVAAELSNEATRNLAGYFDVLIQMDLAQKQRNERRSKEDEANRVSAPNADNAGPVLQKGTFRSNKARDSQGTSGKGK